MHNIKFEHQMYAHLDPFYEFIYLHVFKILIKLLNKLWKKLNNKNAAKTCLNTL